MAATTRAAIRRWIAWSARTPSGPIGHPVVVFALVLLAANDHLLKRLSPGFVTGKISDIAGLIVFPILLVALTELVRPALMTRRATTIAVACLVTALVFAVVKSVPAATDLFNDGLGYAQWALGGGPLAGTSPVMTRSVTDPTDLLALPAILLAFWVATPAVEWDRLSRRVSPVAVVVLMVAGLASIATSPAMRSSSTNYTEELQLTQAAPAITRHMSIDITNRDAKLGDITLLARAYSKGTFQGAPSELDTEGVLVTLIADDVTGAILPSGQYFGPELSFTELCRQSCHEGATVVVRLTDPASAAAGPIITNLEVTLHAGGDQGTGGVDIDLGLTSNADRAFAGAPLEVSGTESGSAHVGADQPEFTSAFDIVVDAAALREPFGYPLIGEIAVWHDNKTAVGHDNALTSSFAFESPSLEPYQWPYSFVNVGVGWVDEPAPPPTVIDLLPLCDAESECRIRATLTANYDAFLNEPERSGDPAVLGSISFDWHVQVRLLAFDGRTLPEGAITFEPAD